MWIFLDYIYKVFYKAILLIRGVWSIWYTGPQGHRKLWHSCSCLTISMWDLRSNNAGLVFGDYWGSAEHWYNRSQSFSQVADWNNNNITITLFLVIKVLTNLRLSQCWVLITSCWRQVCPPVWRECLCLTLKWSQSFMALKRVTSSPGISDTFSPSLQAVLSQHCCSPRAAPTTVVMPVFMFSCSFWALLLLPCREFSCSLSTAMSTTFLTKLRSMTAPIAEAREVERSRAWQLDFFLQLRKIRLKIEISMLKFKTAGSSVSKIAE